MLLWSTLTNMFNSAPWTFAGLTSDMCCRCKALIVQISCLKASVEHNDLCVATSPPRFLLKYWSKVFVTCWNCSWLHKAQEHVKNFWKTAYCITSTSGMLSAHVSLSVMRSFLMSCQGSSSKLMYSTWINTNLSTPGAVSISHRPSVPLPYRWFLKVATKIWITSMQQIQWSPNAISALLQLLIRYPHTRLKSSPNYLLACI